MARHSERTTTNVRLNLCIHSYELMSVFLPFLELSLVQYNQNCSTPYIDMLLPYVGGNIHGSITSINWCVRLFLSVDSFSDGPHDSATEPHKSKLKE